MLSYKESLKILKETNALLEGHFILSSGLHSKQYIQCAKLLSHPQQASIICKSLSEKINEKINEIGRQLDVETIFAERVDGKLILRRGFLIPKNSKVLIVEDVITTGKSALECADLIKENNSILLGYSCIIDRSTESSLIDNEVISQIKFNIQAYTENNLPDELKKIIPLKPGSRNLSKWKIKN